MRYAEGGGLTAEGRARREDVRLQAARLFEQDVDARRIARILRVSTKSVYQWRRAWRADSDAALASKGQGGYACRLDEGQPTRLRAALDLGPAVYGGLPELNRPTYLFRDDQAELVEPSLLNSPHLGQLTNTKIHHDGQRTRVSLPLY